MGPDAQGLQAEWRRVLPAACVILRGLYAVVSRSFEECSDALVQIVVPQPRGLLRGVQTKYADAAWA